jgi:DNA-binding MarR family transcriptional regulator
MENNSTIHQIEPLGRLLALTGKSFLQVLNEKLSYLDFQRNYLALMLIELGEGNLTQKELARLLETDKVSVVRVVDYLGSKGYVERVESSVDRRKYCLTLTEKAKEVLPGIKKSMQETTAAAFEGLTGLQQSEFISTLGQIKKNLSKAKNIGL